MNCPSDSKNFANSRPSASNLKSFPRSVKQFFLTVGRKILVTKYRWHLGEIGVLVNFTVQELKFLFFKFFVSVSLMRENLRGSKENLRHKIPTLETQ